MKHVFIDTNVLLRIYSFSDDYPNLLEDIIKKIESGDIQLYLTEQIIDEFYRNREVKLRDSLKSIKELEEVKFKIPAFCKEIQAIKDIQKKFKEINDSSKKAYKELLKDALDETLELDKLFDKLCKKIKILNLNPDIIKEAKERFDKGNPPGKNNSYGDAINWTLLLKEVPQMTNLFLITSDSDFVSKIDDNEVNSFLKNEWKKRKNSKLILYKSLSRFLKEEFKENKITDAQIKEEENLTFFKTNQAHDIWHLGSSPAFSSGSTASFFDVSGVNFLNFRNEYKKMITCPICNGVYGLFGDDISRCPYCALQTKS